jgi:MscS family membrane protein
MKWRFAWVYRLGLLALLILGVWAVWRAAQEGAPSGALAAVAGRTNAPVQNFYLAGIFTNAAGIGTTNVAAWVPTFGLDQVDALRQTAVLGQPLWKYLAFLIFIVLAFFVARLIDWIVNVWLKRLTAQAKTKPDDLLLELLHGPVKIIALVIFLHIGLGLFDWPEHAQLLLSHGLIVVVACSVTYLGIKLVDLLLGVWLERIISPKDKIFALQLIPLVSKVAKTGLVLAAVFITAENLEIKITSALAGLSVGGLALGLAAQDTVANLFGAVAIFLDKPFYLGDWIKVEGVEGAVESIGLRSIRVRNDNGHLVTIPNKLMGNAIITNITRRPTIKSQFSLGLTYDTPAKTVARAVAVLEEIFRAHPRTGGLIISFNKFGDSALNILVQHEWKGTDDQAHAADMQAFNLQIKERFDAEKIGFAFPTRTVYLRSDGAAAAPPAGPAT